LNHFLIWAISKIDIERILTNILTIKLVFIRHKFCEISKKFKFIALKVSVLGTIIAQKTKHQKAQSICFKEVTLFIERLREAWF
jgi:hypothetical protein